MLKVNSIRPCKRCGKYDIACPSYFDPFRSEIVCCDCGFFIRGLGTLDALIDKWNDRDECKGTYAIHE